MCGNSLAKGQRLLVEGRLQIRNYVAKDGNKRYVTEVIANSVEFVERKNIGSVGSNADGGQEHTASKSGMDGFGKAVAFDEEIPF